MTANSAERVTDDRKDRMGLLTETGPDVVYIKRDGDAFNVTENYHSPQRKPRKQFTIDSPEDYVQRSGVVIIDDMED